MRRALLLVFLLAAGCAAPADEPGGASDGSTAAFTRTDLGPGGPEPVVAVAPDDGTVYVGAQDPRGGGPRVWVSRDGARTFTAHRPTSEGGGEVDLAAGPEGAVYVTQLGTRGNIVSVSHDHGRTWSTSPLGTQSQYFDREWLAVDDEGRAYALARQFGANAVAGVSRSDDGGVTWLPRGNAWSGANEPGYANGNLLARGDALHLAYVCRDGHGVCTSLSSDAAQSWTQALAVERGAMVDNVYPTIARSRAGVLVAWSDASEGHLAVYTAHSPDGLQGWSAPQRVSPAGATGTLAWASARDDTAWIVYLTADKALAATDQDAEARWIPVAQRLDERGAPLGEAVRLQEEPVHTGPISKPIGGSTNRDRNFGDFFTATLDASGRLLVAVSTDEGTPESTRDLLFVQS